MLTVEEAQALVLQHARTRAPRTLPLSLAYLGQVLAEDIVCDRDAPPYDKALVDGYAIRAVDLGDGKGSFRILEEVTAGRVPTVEVGPGQATRIMTGAPLPQGADAVVMVERTRLIDEGNVHIEDRPPSPGANILKQGREMRRGEVVLTAGTVLRPVEYGLLASLGRTEVLMHPAPRVAILATGDELVPAGETPGPGQIRNGNGPMLAALAARTGAVAEALGIARDHHQSLSSFLEVGLKSDVLVLSGGVSAGKLDLVPDALRNAGVTPHFHQVRMKPGKPMFFGTQGQGTLVFGLPGNPVSSLVCFALFVRPALRVLAGLKDPETTLVPATLVEDFDYASDRPTYHPAWLETGPSGWTVRAVPWFGSADLRGLTRANAFVLFPAGNDHRPAGQTFPVLRGGL